MAPEHTTTPGIEVEEGWHWNVGRVAGVVLTLALAGFWIWAFSPLPDRGNPDRMSDRTFVAVAEGICAQTRSMIDDLPPATTATDFAARADLIDQGTSALRAMIAELDEVPVDTAEEAGWVDAWLADYLIYTEDRDAYAARLRNGDDDAPTFTVRGSEGVPTLVTGFAKVNDMPSCEVPGDV